MPEFISILRWIRDIVYPQLLKTNENVKIVADNMEEVKALNTSIEDGVLPFKKITTTTETIDSLLTLYASDGDTVIVKDINRGGIFIYDATQSDVNNGGTIFDGWVRQYSGAVNVKWFGLDTIIFDGDSITEGNTIGFKYSEWLETLSYCQNNNITTQNFSIGGGVITGTGGDGGVNNNLNYRYPLYIYPQRPSSKGGTGAERVYLHILIGVNDLNPNYGNKSAATVISELTSYVSMAKNDGFTVILSTILPVALSYWTYTVDTKRREVNEAIRRGYIGADYVSDLADLLTDPTDLNVFQDGIHPTSNGAKIIANYINDNLNNGLITQVDDIGNSLSSPTVRGRLKLQDHSFLEVGTAYQKTSIGSDNNFSTGFVLFEDLNDTRVNTKKWQIASGFGQNRLHLQALADNNTENYDIMTWERTGITSGYKTKFRGALQPIDNGGWFQAGDAYNRTFLGHFNGSGAGYIINENLQGFGTDTKYSEIMQGSDNTFNINFVNDAITDVQAALKIYRSGNVPISFNVGSHLSPIADNAYSLGGSANRWSVVYAGSGTINTSDDREKTYRDISEVEMLVAKELKGLMKSFKFNDSIEEKGIDKARIHYGTSAQSIKSTFEKYGLVAEDYAILCHDEWEAEYEQVIDAEAELDEEGNVIKEATYKNGDLIRDAGDRYGIRYEELLCFIISAM